MLSKRTYQQKINKHLKDIARNFKINKKLTMHVGRHTFATNFLRAGGAVQDLQIILGHQSLVTTMIYVHINEDEAMESIGRLNSYFTR